METPMNGVPILNIVVTSVCAIRFLLDGVSIFGSIMFPHVDPLAYSAILSPLIAGHAYMHVRGSFAARQKVDNPDDT